MHLLICSKSRIEPFLKAKKETQCLQVNHAKHHDPKSPNQVVYHQGETVVTTFRIMLARKKALQHLNHSGLRLLRS